MNIALILAIICGSLGMLSLLFRSNAVYMFLGLCAGSVVAELAAQDITQLLNSFISVNVPVYSYVQVFLLMIIPVLLFIIFRKSSGAKIIMHIIPAIAFALLSYMFITNMLPYDLQNQIIEADIYMLVKPYFILASVAGALSCLIYLWGKRPHHDKHHKKHK